MVNNRSDINNNSERASAPRLPVATRAISRPTRVTRRLSHFIVSSVPVRSHGGDGNIAPEDEEKNRLDSLLQVQRRLDRHVTHIRN